MEILYIVIPAYNEESIIQEVVQSWYTILDKMDEKSRLVVADSGSTDKTHTILLEMLKEYPKLVILSDADKQHGPKLISLYSYAIHEKADYIFQTDADGQTSTEEFRGFWNLRNEYDGIFGYRKMRGDGKFRAFVEKVVCLLLKIYFGVNIPDANAPFRLMKTDVVKKYLYKMSVDYNLPNILMTMYFTYYKEKIIFQTITFKARRKGASSLNLFKIIKIGWNALHDFKELKKGLN